jgi:hypothetical protein
MNTRYLPADRPVPYFHHVLVLVREIFVQWNKPELLQYMLHNGPGHHYPDIVTPVKPAADQGLRVALVPVAGDDIVEVEPVAGLQFQPAREEVVGKSQCIAIRGSGLNALCFQELSRPFLPIMTVVTTILKGDRGDAVKVNGVDLPAGWPGGIGLCTLIPARNGWIKILS